MNTILKALQADHGRMKEWFEHLRDVLSAQVPLILQRDIYATAAIAGISVYLLLQWVGMPPPIPAALGMVTVVGLRMLAIMHGLHLPVIRTRRDPT